MMVATQSPPAERPTASNFSPRPAALVLEELKCWPPGQAATAGLPPPWSQLRLCLLLGTSFPHFCKDSNLTQLFLLFECYRLCGALPLGRAHRDMHCSNHWFTQILIYQDPQSAENESTG